ncbi:hypothetical protein DIE28_11105 [Paracoccus thiocyanatus]|uniref:HTH lysR-type domain-containing protein n=1 Tax=Paracoccus thiocyanatus TaxID=34006 RepID=A0A3D8PBU0_9RHOB|nr:hypothetical protein DIE28_11105 [Paracoccus thiocyanatus]
MTNTATLRCPVDFSLRQIAHFLSVMETSSFLKASLHANVSQPALSKSIKTLEDRLGVALFERLPRGVRPTPHGLAFERYARRILVDARRAAAEMGDVSAGVAGHIIAGIGTPYVESVRDILPAFRDLYPNARLEVITGFAGHLGKLLAENKIDIVLAMYNGIQQEDRRGEFTFEHWYSDGFVGICPLGHPVENKVNPPEELARYSWAMPLIEQSAMSALRSGFTSAAIRFPGVALTTDSIELLKHAVTRLSMLSIAPGLLADSAEFGGVGRFQISGFQFRRKIGIIQRRDYELSPIHKSFLSLVRQRFTPASPHRAE